MSEYKVTDPTSGSIVTLTGDSPPTEKELEIIFSEISVGGVSTKQIASGIRGQKDKKDLYDLWGAGISDERAKASPAMAMAKFLQKNVTTPALSFVNQAGANLPRALAAKQGVSFPEENLIARGAGIGGAVAGVPSMISKGVGQGIGRVAPNLGAIGSKFAGLGATLKGAIQGGAVGAAYTPTDAETLLAPEERLQQAAFGALAGGIVSRIGHGYRVRKANKLLPERLAQIEKDLIKQGSNKNIRMERIKVSAANATKTLKGNIENLQKQLTTSIQKAVPQYKEGFKTFFKGFNDTYGSQLDDISSNIGEKITKTQASDFVDDVVAKLSKNPDFAETRAITHLKSLAKRLRPKGKGAFDSLFKKSGKTKEVPITFRKLNSMMKETLQGRKYDGKSNIDNLVYDELRHSYGDFVATYDKSGAFASLQKEASKVLEVKRFASKVFKPNSKYQTEGIEKLLQKKASGKLSAGEQELLTDINKILKEFGGSVDDIAEQIATKKTKLGSISGRKQSAISKTAVKNTKRVSDLKEKKVDIKASMPKKNSIAANIVDKAVNVAIAGVVYKMIRKVSP